MTPNTIVCGDALAVLTTWPADCIDCVVTSPPYFGLRDYKINAQLGLEKTPAEYLAKTVAIFEQVRRVLKPTGTAWVNMGDSYAGSGKAGNPDDSPHQKQGFKPKDLMGIPWRLAFALQDAGWYLRSDIIWHKPNPMPESVTDRPTKAHEYLFLLSKSSSYYYDYQAIMEPSVTDDPRRPYGSQGAWDMDGRPDEQKHGGEPRAQASWKGSQFHTGKTAEYQLGRASVKRGGFNGKNKLPGKEAFRAFTETRNKRTVWTIPSEPYRGAHFATFPTELVRPCILAGCPADGVVLDPFMGSGTVALVAAKLGRNYAGVEINPDYIALAKQRLGLFA